MSVNNWQFEAMMRYDTDYILGFADRPADRRTAGGRFADEVIADAIIGMGMGPNVTRMTQRDWEIVEEIRQRKAAGERRRNKMNSAEFWRNIKPWQKGEPRELKNDKRALHRWRVERNVEEYKRTHIDKWTRRGILDDCKDAIKLLPVIIEESEKVEKLKPDLTHPESIIKDYIKPLDEYLAIVEGLNHEKHWDELEKFMERMWDPKESRHPGFVKERALDKLKHKWFNEYTDEMEELLKSMVGKTGNILLLKFRDKRLDKIVKKANRTATQIRQLAEKALEVWQDWKEVTKRA